MSAAEKPMYLAFVKFDLICKEFERQYHEYFDEHVREWTLKDGCLHGWRTREFRAAPNEGLLEQEFWQIYHINNPHLFKPQRTPPKPTEKNPWLRDRSNWGRVFYNVLSYGEKDKRLAKCWARFETNFSGTPGEESAFRKDCAKHITRVLELPGIHRAWQLEYLPHELEIGDPAPARHMCLYEIDAPENIFDVGLGTEVLPFDSRWSAHQLTPAGRHFAQMLQDLPAPA